jgi:hypothetical protein
MGKLHEILAVESDLKAEAQRVTSQIKALFTDGRAKLTGQIRTYQPLYEDGEDFADEITEMAATVSGELTRYRDAFGRWVDAAVQKEVTNQHTSASVMINGDDVLGPLPATALLNLESKLVELRQVYAVIPTNDLAERWDFDYSQGHYVSQERVNYRTQKIPKAFVAHEATPEHPAQVTVFNEDARVGAWHTVIQSGMLSPVEKRNLLVRIDLLLREIKQARQRANDLEVKQVNVSERLFAFIHGE